MYMYFIILLNCLSITSTKLNCKYYIYFIVDVKLLLKFINSKTSDDWRQIKLWRKRKP